MKYDIWRSKGTYFHRQFNDAGSAYSARWARTKALAMKAKYPDHDIQITYRDSKTGRQGYLNPNGNHEATAIYW